MCRGGEGEAVATVMLVGGGGDSRVRERESRGERRRARESAREVGVARGVVPGHSDEEGRGRQAGREVAWGGGVRARRARSPPSVEEEDDRGGGGLGRLLAGPACCCWARGARQKPR